MTDYTLRYLTPSEMVELLLADFAERSWREEQRFHQLYTRSRHLADIIHDRRWRQWINKNSLVITM